MQRRGWLVILAIMIGIAIPSVAFAATWQSLYVEPKGTYVGGTSFYIPDPFSVFDGSLMTSVAPVTGLRLPYVAWLEHHQHIETTTTINSNSALSSFPYTMDSRVVTPRGKWRFEAYSTMKAFALWDDAVLGDINWRWNCPTLMTSATSLHFGLGYVPLRTGPSDITYSNGYTTTAGWTVMNVPPSHPNSGGGRILQRLDILHAQGGVDGAGKYWYAYTMTSSFYQGAALVSKMVQGKQYVIGLTTAPSIRWSYVKDPNAYKLVALVGGQQGHGTGDNANVGNLRPSTTNSTGTTYIEDVNWQAWAGYQEDLESLPQLPDGSGDTSATPDATDTTPVPGDPEIPGFDWTGMLDSITSPLRGVFDGLMWPFRAFSSIAGTVTP